MKWQDRRVLVTGATGFIGSWLVKRLLNKGASVIVLIRDWDPQSELIRSGDVNRCRVVNGALEEYAAAERSITENEVDTLFHLGAQTLVGTALRSPLGTFEANIRGTYNLLEACRVHSSLVEHVVVASSDKAYGEVKQLPYTEETPTNGRHPYDVSKSCSDLIAMAYAHTYNLPVTVARCGNVYGGGDLNWSRIVPGTIRSIFQNQRPVLRSNGKFTRDYVFVEDVVNAYLTLGEKAAEKGIRGEAFNFSPEEPVAVTEITAMIQSLMGRLDLEPVVLDQAKAEIKDQSLDSGKARRVLQWSPEYSLEDGLKKTVSWYREFLRANGEKRHFEVISSREWKVSN